MKVFDTRASLVLTGLLMVRIGSAAVPITLEADVRDVSQGIQHAHLTIPVHPGSVTLSYPKWIPGEHVATGPIAQVVSLSIKAADKTLAWRRDPLDPFNFRIEVPEGVESLDVRFDYLSPTKIFGDGYGYSPNVTPHLLTLPFNHLILYPREAAADEVMVQATVRLPDGWKFDSALHPEHADGGRVSFPAVSLTTLIDSPLFAGQYFRSIPLTDGPGSTRISIVADAAADLAVPDAMIAGFKRLAPEAQALLGPGHYREYVWLVALSNTIEPSQGLEHHESTDIRDTEALFTDPVHRLEHRTIPHEYVHSWNGKYRRPQGLATRNYQEPMVDDLLWVYEGMTRYLGDLLLRTRSGLVNPAQARDYIAWIASRMDAGRPGRAWRSLGDTAVGLPGFNNAADEWTPIRRGRDYYDEMLLVWLDADTLIREKTGGRHSLDEFCARFFAGPERTPALHPYTRADLVEALRAVAPLDWEAFFAARIDATSDRAPLDGLKRSGWTLQYDDTPNEFQSAREKTDSADNFSLSLGIYTGADGTVTDVVHGSPAFGAGIAPTMKILAIGGHKWSADAARDVIVGAEKTSAPIDIVVENADLVRVVQLNYHGGLKFPHLVRDHSSPDVLAKILSPKSK